MENVLFIVKIVVIFQALLILLVILFLYMGNLFFLLKEKRESKNKKKITYLMDLYFNKETIPIDGIGPLKNSIVFVLSVLRDMDKKYQGSEAYHHFKQELSQHVLRPYARKAAFSRDWYKRYTAALCYCQGINSKDEGILSLLIQDKSFLVAMTATKCAIQIYTPKLVNVLIDEYSNARHIRQSVYAKILMRNKPDISTIITDRLQKEQNPYVKAFCYRLLSRLPKEKQILFPVEQDLENNSVELKIAALKYISYMGRSRNHKMIYRLSEDVDWQVRAITAKALETVDTQESIRLLETLLKDKNKWVKTNAAYSLIKKGKKGIAILEKQSQEVDEQAYDIAQEMLRQLHGS